MTIRTAVHPSIWIDRFDAETLHPVVEKAGVIGFDHVIVPLRRFQDINPQAIARVFEAQGLKPLNTASLSPDNDIGSGDADARQRGIAQLATAISLARDMGSPQINGVLYAPIRKAEAPAAPDNFLRSAESMGTVSRIATDAGVRLSIEIVNRYETNLLNTVEQGLSFMTASGSSDLLLHLDTFHMNIEERNLKFAIRQAAGKIGYFELDQSHRGSLNQGSIDLLDCLETLRELNYDGIIGIEAFSASKMATDHAAALAIWRNTFSDGDQLAKDGLQLIRMVFPLG